MGKKKILRRQPLVYSLISVETTEIPNLESNLGPLHTALTGLKFSDGPLPTETKEVSIGLPPSASSNDISANISGSKKRWDFLNLERSQGIVVSTNNICLKQTAYTKFEDMLEIFEKVLDCFESTIENFHGIGIKRIGLRYIDVLIPLEGDDLTDYVSDQYKVNLLSSTDDISVGSDLNRLTSRAQTDFGTLQHSFIENKAIDGRISLLPPEFNEPPNVALQPVIQDHWENLGERKYALLDIDHFSNYHPLLAFEDANVSSRIKNLYKVASAVFWNALSNKALDAYQLEEMDI